MTKTYPKLILYVVYRSNNGYWRGFCSPYNVTCEARTKESAKQKLEKLVDLYVEGLKKYNYPKHLSMIPLTEKEDNKVQKIVLEKICEDIKENYIKFQVERNKRVLIKDCQSKYAYANFYPCLI